MATGVKLPTKRDHATASDTGDEAAEASKKAKAVVMEEEEAGSGDELMPERSVSGSVSDDEIMSDRDRNSEADDESVPARVRDSDGDNDSDSDDDDSLRDSLSRDLYEDLVRDSDRAKRISSEKKARKVFTKDEMAMFRGLYWTKTWHIRTNPDDSTKLTDYQRLAIYPSRDRTHTFHHFKDYFFTYEFDCAYPAFTAELSQKITWIYSTADARPIAEEIWRRHMPHTDVNLDLLYDTVFTTLYNSDIRQSSIELSSLFFDLYKCEVDVKDYVQALQEIIKEKGLERYPCNKAFIEEEGLKKHDGLLWYKYCSMKSFCNIQKGEALEDNRLEELIASYFECHTPGPCDCQYTKYVEAKIRIAEKLGILSR